MSKIEEALRLAKEQNIKSIHDGRGRTVGHSTLIEAQADFSEKTTLRGSRKLTESEGPIRPPAIYQLQPANHYELDQKVLERNRIINDKFPEAAMTSYKMLRTRVMQKMFSNDWKIIAVTSPLDGAGKTVTATNLAITAASQGAHDVYLLDLDLRNPGIASCLGLPADGPDLSQYLAGSASFSQACCDVGIGRLVVVPASGTQSNSSELITSKPMFGLLTNILSAATGPIIILDLPAVLSADDVLAISPIVDGFVVVVSESETVRGDVSRTMDMLHDANVLGVVLNKYYDS